MRVLFDICFYQQTFNTNMQIDIYYRKNNEFVHHADVKFRGWPNLWVSTVYYMMAQAL